MGLSINRAATVRKLASAVARGELSFDNSKPHEDTIDRMRVTCDVSESTAQWIAMRSCGEPDAFPAGDPKLRRRLGKGVLLPTRDALRAAEQWRPWRAYAALHLTV